MLPQLYDSSARTWYVQASYMCHESKVAGYIFHDFLVISQIAEMAQLFHGITYEKWWLSSSKTLSLPEDPHDIHMFDNHA